MIKLTKRAGIWLIKKMFGDLGGVWLESESMIRKLRNGYCYEKEIALLQYLVSRGDICLDVGANFGQWTYWMSKQVGPLGKVIAVEPVPITVSVLRRVINRLKLSNVTICEKAVGDRNCQIGMRLGFYRDVFEKSYVARVIPNDQSNNVDIKVNMCTMSTILESFDIGKINFIKCDIEGGEMPFFQGGIHVLEQNKPAIICEIEEKHTKEFGYHPDDLFSLLKGLGYRSFRYTLNEVVPVVGIVPDERNYIFLHECDESISKLLQEISQ